MRRSFADSLLSHAIVNPNIFLLTGDLGYKVFDEFQHVIPTQFINCGASEQAMMDMAVGLAYGGKIPVVYSITPFLIYRPFETLRTYINHEKLNVKLIGSGRDADYAHDGYSHDACDVESVLKSLPNIHCMFPNTSEDIPSMVEVMLKDTRPVFMSLKR